MDPNVIEKHQGVAKRLVFDISKRFVEAREPHKDCIAVFVAGSFAAWLENPNGEIQPAWYGLPDINLYALLDAPEHQMTTAEKSLGQCIIESASRSGVNVILDLHPFAMSSGLFKPDSINIQFTARILNLANPAYYADYSWNAWYRLNYALYQRDADLFRGWRPPPCVRNNVWIRNMYLALTSYGNILHMLSLTHQLLEPGYVFDETVRYLKELAKDGIAIGIPLNVAVPSEREYKSVNFFGDRFGPEAHRIAQRLREIEMDYFGHRQHFDGLDDLISDAVLFKEILFYDGLRHRIAEWKSSTGEDLSLVFSAMPLWY